MTEEIIKQAILFIVSFTANLFASVSGGGAGFIQFPLLVLLGLPFATALGTHKVAVVFLGIGALARKGKLNEYRFDKQISCIMLFLGGPAVILGSLIIIKLPTQAAEIALGIITICCGIYTLFKKSFGAKTIEHRSLQRNIIGAVLIFLVGLFSGSLSSGAGLFSTLTLAGVFGLELKKAIMHTMIFVATIWNAIGAITVGSLMGIHWQWVPVMIIATFTGAWLGTNLLLYLPVRIVRIIFSFVAMLSGVILLCEAF